MPFGTDYVGHQCLWASRYRDVSDPAECGHDTPRFGCCATSGEAARGWAARGRGTRCDKRRVSGGRRHKNASFRVDGELRGSHTVDRNGL